MKILILFLSLSVAFGQDMEYQSLGACTGDLVAEYGERESFRAFQEGKIEDSIPAAIDELYGTNKTEVEETKQAYSEFQDELAVNREANEAWNIVARGKGENMEVVMDAGFRLDAMLGGEEKGIVSVRFWGWLKRNCKKIVKIVIIVVRAFLKFLIG
ncbi:uncharacterized protein LOC110859607 [Folsomia candida]|uniref:uncharacterized protein LOC110859607 n=1 Tax=Folsomia candida TaxID=158441 RepID=UPI000B8F8476|nr:uncharacterized protein LOC110859607 [Folsomia candida]